MLYRAGVLAVIGFWLVMTALLIRLEISPEKTRLQDVPPTHALKLMFQHGQISNLNILQGGGETIGRLTLHPRQLSGSSERILGTSGSVWLRTGLFPKQRAAWDGFLAMDETFGLRDFRLQFTFREPGVAAAIRITPDGPRLHYELKRNQTVIDSSSFTLDELGIRSALRELGVDETMVGAFTPARMGQPSVTARQSRMKVHGETIGAYVLTVRVEEVVFAEIWLTQLGEVLTVNTPFGYSLAAEDTSF